MTAMNERPGNKQHSQTRRRFLKTGSIGLAGIAALGRVPLVHAAPLAAETEIRIGLIGCGGRGTGAAANAIGAATKVIYPSKGYHTEDITSGANAERKGIKIVALADLFENRLVKCAENLKVAGMEVPKKYQFTGFDAYQQLLEVPEVNYVIQATPPKFRPQHLMAAIEAGKHVFIEKPAAVDPVGAKLVMKAGELARKKGLGIVAGTQRRHERRYQEAVKRLHDGAIGDIVYAKCYWNGGEIWVIDRDPAMSDMEWQLRNWNYFTWLSGDHYVEQHVHNLDVMNWVIGTHPTKAVSGLGGRQVRTDPKFGNIFDHFAVEFQYPGGISMFSQARQINNCKGMVEEFVQGTAGTSNCRNWIRSAKGEDWEVSLRPRRGEPKDLPYDQEHLDLIESIKQGNPLNEAQAVAESTLTGIMGREACYSGQEVTWEQVMESTMELGPQEYEFGPYPTPPVAMPGFYKFSSQRASTLEDL
jgi:predicted dehydrogenase